MKSKFYFFTISICLYSSFFVQAQTISALIIPSPKAMEVYHLEKVKGEIDIELVGYSSEFEFFYNKLDSFFVNRYSNYPIKINEFKRTLYRLQTRPKATVLKSELIKKFNLLIEFDFHIEKKGGIQTLVKEVIFFSNDRKITVCDNSVNLIGGLGQPDPKESDLIDSVFFENLSKKFEDVLYYFEQLPNHYLNIERVKFEGKKGEQNKLNAYWRYPNSQETYGEKNYKQNEGEIDLGIAYNNKIYIGTYTGQYVKLKMQQLQTQIDKNGVQETVSIDKSSFEWPHGKGKFISNGLVIEGEWLEGKLNGKCILLQKDSLGNLILKYDGDFLNSERHGKGNFDLVNRYKYTGDWLYNKMQGHGIITYSNGNTYDGQWSNNLREGKGIYLNNLDKNSFVKISGNWVANKKEGDGIIYYENGDSLVGTVFGNFKPKFTGKGILHLKDGYYNGEFQFSEFSGLGRFTYNNGDYKEGSFISGDLNEGKMTIHFNDGTSYSGDIKSGKFEGLGSFTWSNGSIYSGEWKNGKQNGKGKIVDFEGTITEGLFSNNAFKEGTITKPNGEFYKGTWDEKSIFKGKAKKISSDKSIWEGEWTGNIPSGSGKVIFSDGRIYEGEWSGRETAEYTYYDIQGLGKMTYPNKEIYIGLFKLGSREGNGTYNYSNRDIYTGNWQNNIRNGLGELKYANGDLYKGSFKNDAITGSGVMRFSNGDIYEGNFSNGIRSGYGKMTFKNNNIYEGNWDNNLQNGKGKLIYFNGQVSEGIFKEGTYLVPAKLESVVIGKQIWSLKNLNVDKFRNGEPIPQVRTPEEWARVAENGQPAWCYYDFNEKNGAIYGKLYNWYAVNDSRGLAPFGWHIPTANEFHALLENFRVKPKNGEYIFGATDAAITKLRSKTGWSGENGDNESGFSGLPAGYIGYFEAFTHDWKYYPGHWGFASKGESSAFWSATCCIDFNSSASALDMSSWGCSVGNNNNKGIGYSVRLIKD